MDHPCDRLSTARFPVDGHLFLRGHSLCRRFGLWNRRQLLTLIGVRLFPKLPGKVQCIDFQPLPPGNFIAGLMQLPVTAERDREFVADFEAQCARLRKA